MNEVKILFELYKTMYLDPTNELFASQLKKHSSMINKLSFEQESEYYGIIEDWFKKLL